MPSIVLSDPEIMSGTPCFRGTRVPVKTLFDYLAHNHPLDEFLDDFPTVYRDQALAALQEAQEKLLAPYDEAVAIEYLAAGRRRPGG
ncbi:MAG TPA: DUF433 domain-containing protein [Thermoanaerobaculia bacterium]|nr:DUF433 domain-containing protein [Thermoanaerobaculia bacterium]